MSMPKQQLRTGESTGADAHPAPRRRKPFVEPAISHPVDVLEATTFFQVVDSGGTGKPPKKPTGEGQQW